MTMERLSVLVIEDDKGWQRILRKAFESCNCKVDVVDNYDEAEKELRTGKVDIVILDLLLSSDEEKFSISVSSGWQLLVNKLKENHQNLFICVITGGSLDTQRAFDLSAKYGVNEFMSKGGFEPAVLHEWIHKARLAKQAFPQPNGYDEYIVRLTLQNQILVSSSQGEEQATLALNLDALKENLALLASGETNSQLLKQVGSELFQTLFPDKLELHFRKSLAAALTMDRGIQLRLAIDQPQLLSLPWELLYDKDTKTFLANNKRTALSRYIPLSAARREFRQHAQPLKILLVLASPNDLPAVDLSAEEMAVRQVLEELVLAEKVEIDVLTHATISKLNQKLQEKPYRLLHFIGHGGFDNEKGSFLAFENKQGAVEFINGEQFGNLLLNYLHLDLIILNSCQSASLAERNALMGLAPHIIQQGIPAVIAMQYAIDNDTATIFANQFYHFLTSGHSLDVAMQLTRHAISLERGLDKPSFITPVLFMRSDKGFIF